LCNFRNLKTNREVQIAVNYAYKPDCPSQKFPIVMTSHPDAGSKSKAQQMQLRENPKYILSLRMQR